MKHKLLLLFIIATSINGFSQNVVIPDAVFKSSLVNNVAINTNEDTEISIAEAEAFTGTIDVSESEILDLTGLEAFINITELYCQYNDDLTTLNVASNTALTLLRCSGNQITSLDVTNNTALTSLDFGDNQITSIDLANNTQLTYLATYQNTLNSIDLSSNTALEILSIRSCGLTNLDVTNNTALTLLTAGSNNITNLDVTKNTALTYLSFNSDSLESIDVSQNTSLETLQLNYNNLTSINVTNNPLLTDLQLSGNQIEVIDLTSNVNLYRFYIHTNELTSLDVSNAAPLHFFLCNDNQIETLNLTNNTDLSSFNCSNNMLTNLDFTNNTSLSSLTCSNNMLTNLDFTNNTGLRTLTCDNNQLTNLNITNNSNLEDIICYNNKLENLNLENIILLEELSCADNLLTSLDITNSPDLTRFNCENNELTDLNLANGNNESLSTSVLDITGNSDLVCIGVDDTTYSDTNWSSLKDATASFSTNCNIELNYTIENGTISVDLAPTNGDNYILGDVVTLTVTPNSNYKFSNWSGDASGTTNPLVLTMDEDKDITALLVEIREWLGTANNDWFAASNWQGGLVPDATSDVVIATGLTNYPTIEFAVTVNSIDIASGATLIADVDVIGEVTYHRNIADTNWHLVSSPVAGETYEDIILNHDLAIGATNGSETNIGIGEFNNSGTTPWSYATASKTGTITLGQGHSIKLDATADLSFTGTANTSSVIYTATTGDRNSFNLIGNPFTAYINSKTLVKDNSSAESDDPDSTTIEGSIINNGTLWFWDGTQYVTINYNTPIDIAPAQGFFMEVNPNKSVDEVVFNTSSQTHQTTDTFMKEESDGNFELQITNGEKTSSTKVFYVDSKTTGFDIGYDSKMFGGVDHDFAVFTELLTDNDGRKLAIQTLPIDNTTAIPVGIIASAGEEITFSVESLNLPNDTTIHLEDKVTGEFINLSEDIYKTVLENDTNSIGQFYIHTTAKSLSNEEIIENSNNVSIYKSSNTQITITGFNADGNVSIFSLLGKQVLKTNIKSSDVSKVDLPILSTGVYIIKLNSEYGEVTKKITLN